MSVSGAYRPEPAFAALGDAFSDVVTPARFPAPRLRVFDGKAAARVGLETLTPHERDAHFIGFAPLPDNQPNPRAIRYHGHQFRTYNPDIGDGRGFLFAQLRDVDGRLLDLGTKGSGQTPYSRSGDGRMTLQAGVREVIAARLLAARGVPTCAILALAETGETLARYDEPGPVRGAVLTRLQHSHIRIGVFQRHAAHDDAGALNALVEHCVAVYAPACAHPDADARAAALLAHAVRANAALAARWMAAGFVHGVLNSDNMVLTGESFDYGPFRFLPVYEPGFTAAYFDAGGLYAYSRQAEATLWNLHRLAESLALIADPSSFPKILESFQGHYQAALAEAMLDRLGLMSGGLTGDLDLARAFFVALQGTCAPFEAAFFDWRGGAAARALASPRARFYGLPEFAPFIARLVDHDARPNALNAPYWRGTAPVEGTIDQVRGVWRAIDEADDWAGLEAYLARIDEAGEAYRADGSSVRSNAPSSGSSA